MFNMTDLQQLNEAHRAEVLRQVQQNRLADTARSGSLSAREAMLARLGSTLVALGTRLQGATEEAAPQTAYR
jgi:hypothetical protein